MKMTISNAILIVLAFVGIAQAQEIPTVECTVYGENVSQDLCAYFMMNTSKILYVDTEEESYSNANAMDAVLSFATFEGKPVFTFAYWEESVESLAPDFVFILSHNEETSEYHAFMYTVGSATVFETMVISENSAPSITDLLQQDF